MLVTAPPWAASHAALPIAHAGRLYFSARDAQGRAHVGRVALAVGDDELRAGEHERGPVLGLGALGAFDDSGVTCSWIAADGGRLLLYYTGWTRGVSVPFYFYVGLAVSEDGGASFTRVSEAPVLERSATDPFLTASPCVLRDGGTWRMWYVSCVRWAIEAGQPKHWYHVRHAVSDDGIAWRRDGRVAIDLAGPEEYAISRPCVVVEDGRYRMWYSHRGDAYRIGYAESADGLSWQRHDDAVGIAGTPGDWDGEMQAYPFVLRAGERRALLYNGDGYGRTGIGYALTK